MKIFTIVKYLTPSHGIRRVIVKLIRQRFTDTTEKTRVLYISTNLFATRRVRRPRDVGTA